MGISRELEQPNNLEKDNEVQGLTISDYKTYQKTAVIKTVWGGGANMAA